MVSPNERTRWQKISGLVAFLLGVTAVTLWLIYRFTAPVTVEIVSDIASDLPFTATVYPSVVQAQPGQLISVTYRIQNTYVQPIEAFGQIEIEPARALDQIQVFLTQCGGLNTFENSYPQDYQVVFRVQAAGLFGNQHLILRHVFTRAAPPRS